MMHRHIWQRYKENVIAIWEKQEGQNSKWPFEGDVKKCLCGKLRFYPKSEKLRKVIVEMTA